MYSYSYSYWLYWYNWYNDLDSQYNITIKIITTEYTEDRTTNINVPRVPCAGTLIYWITLIETVERRSIIYEQQEMFRRRAKLELLLPYIP